MSGRCRCRCRWGWYRVRWGQCRWGRCRWRWCRCRWGWCRWCRCSDGVTDAAEGSASAGKMVPGWVQMQCWCKCRCRWELCREQEDICTIPFALSLHLLTATVVYSEVGWFKLPVFIVQGLVANFDIKSYVTISENFTTDKNVFF